MAAYVYSQDDDPFSRDMQYLSQGLADSLFELGDDIRGANTPAAQRIMSAKVGDETFWNHKFDYLALNTANTAAPIVAGIAAAAIAGPTAGLLINSGLAGMHSAGLTYNDIVKDFDSLYASGELSGNKLFQSLVAEGRSEQEALREFKRLSVGAKPAVLAVVTAAMARFSAGGQIVSKIGGATATGAVTGAARKGILRRVGESTAMSSAEEAAQNTLEEGMMQGARVDAGVQEGYDNQRLIEAALAGGVIGAALGVPAGVFPEGRRGAVNDEDTTDPGLSETVLPIGREVGPPIFPPRPDIRVPDQDVERAPWRPPGAAEPSPRDAYGVFSFPSMGTMDPDIEAALAAATGAAKPVVQKPSSRFRARGSFASPFAEPGAAAEGAPTPGGVPAPTSAAEPPVTPAGRAAAPPPRPTGPRPIQPTTSTPVENAARSNVEVLTEGGTTPTGEAAATEEAAPETVTELEVVAEAPPTAPTDEEATPVTTNSELPDYSADKPEVQAAMQDFIENISQDPVMVQGYLNELRAKWGAPAAAVAPIKVPEDAGTAASEPKEKSAYPQHSQKDVDDYGADEVGVLNRANEGLEFYNNPGLREAVRLGYATIGNTERGALTPAGKARLAELETEPEPAPIKEPEVVPFPSPEMRAKLDKQTPAARAILTTAKKLKKAPGPERAKTTKKGKKGEAVVEKLKTKNKPKTSQVKREQPLPIARAKPPEPDKPAKGVRYPAVEYFGNVFFGKSHNYAIQSLEAGLAKENRKPPLASRITRGYLQDGEFHPIIYAEENYADRNADSEKIAKNIEAMNVSEARQKREQAELQGEEVEPEPQKRYTNPTYKKMQARVEKVSSQIFAKFGYGRSKTMDLRKRIAAIAGLSEKKEKIEKKIFKDFKFGERVSTGRGGAHGWLTRARALNKVWGPSNNPTEQIANFLRVEEELRIERAAGNLKAHPALEISQIEASQNRDLPLEGDEGETGGGLTYPELDEAEALASRNSAYELNRRRTNRQPQKSPGVDIARRPGVRTKPAVTISRTPANLNAIRSSMKRLRDKLAAEGKSIPKYLQIKPKNLTKKQQQQIEAAAAAEPARLTAAEKARQQAEAERQAAEKARKEELVTATNKRIKTPSARAAKAAAKRAADRAAATAAREAEAAATPEAEAAAFAQEQQAKSAGVKSRPGPSGYTGPVEATVTAPASVTIESEQELKNRRKLEQQQTDLWADPRGLKARPVTRPSRDISWDEKDAEVDERFGEELVRITDELEPDTDTDITADNLLNVEEEPTEENTRPDPALKKVWVSKEEAQRRREIGNDEGGWLESPYTKDDVFARIKQKLDVRGVLNKIDYNAAAKGVKGRKGAMNFLRRKLTDIVGDMPVYVVSENDLINFLGNQHSSEETPTHYEMYDGVFVSVRTDQPGQGYIVINDKLFDQDKGRIADNILHEVVHAATLDALWRNPALRKSVEVLMKAVMTHHGITDAKAHYGFTDAYEFVAEGMTNPTFQQLLASTPLSNELATRFGIQQPGWKSAWQGFLTLVAKSIRLPRGQLTALHAIVDVTERLARDTDISSRVLKKGTIDDVMPRAAPKKSAAAYARDTKKGIVDYYSKAGRQESMPVPWLLKIAGLDDIARSSDRFWKDPNNPIRKLYRYLTQIVDQTALNLQAATKVIDDLVRLEKKAGPELWQRFARLINDETTFNVFADRSFASQPHLGKDHVNNPTLKGAQAKVIHERLSAEYDAIIREMPELAKLRNDLHGFLRKRQNRMAHYLVHNILVEGFRGEIDAKDISDALVERILSKKMTEADKALFKASPDLLTRVLRAKELTNMAGPYFPLMRRGNWVVRAKVKVTPPSRGLNGTLRDGTDNVYEFTGDDARERAMEYAEEAARLGDKVTINSNVIDEKTGESWDEDEEGKPVKLTLKDPDTVRVYRAQVMNEYVEYFDNEASADRTAFELESDSDIVPGSIKGVQERNWSPGDRGVDISSADMSLLVQSLEKKQGFKNMNPAMQHQLRLAAQEFGLQMLGSTRVHKRRIARRGVLGASLDITRNFIDYSQSTAAYTARLEFAQEINQTMRDAEASVDAGHRAGAKGRRAIWNEVRKRIDGGNGFDQGSQWYSPAVQRVLTASFITRLASPMYTMMNLLQVGMVAMPVVASRHHVAPTSRAFAKAYKDINAWTVLKKGGKETWAKAKSPGSQSVDFFEDIKKGMNVREQDLLRFIAPQRGLELAKMQRIRRTTGGVKARAQEYGDTALNWAEGISKQLPIAAEMINRSVTLLAAYRLEYAKNGGNHEAALQYADDINNRTNFNYGEINTAPIFNHPLMKIPFQFKRFGFAMYTLLGRDIGKAWRNENPGDRAEALRSLAYVVATHMLMAGTLGLPTEPIKGLVIGAYAFGLSGFNWQDVENAQRELAADLLGPDLGEVLTRGVTRALPFGLAFDLSSRVGMADMFLSREPTSSQMSEHWQWLQDMVLGAPGGMIADMAEGAAGAIKGDWSAAQKAIPVKGLRDLVKAVDTAAFGKETKSGRPSFEAYGIAEAFIRALGATPGREAEDQELKAQFYSQQAYINEQRAKLQQRWADASTSERNRMRGAIERFNRGKPRDAQLTNAVLRAYVSRRRSEIEEMSSGVRPTKSNLYMLQRAEAVYNAR